MERSKTDTPCEYDSPTNQQSGNTIARRGFLKLAGVGATLVAAVTVESESVRGDTTGYGEGEYGNVPYGGDEFSVSTEDVVSVDATSATIAGVLSALDGADSADCYFEWRAVGADAWNATSKQTRSSTGSFSADINNLSDNTDYEYRAVAESSDGSTDTGSVVAFSTVSGSTAPVIDSFSVSGAKQSDSQSEITVEWGVSDADEDLASVDIDVADSSGTVQSVSWLVNGAVASDIDSFVVKHSDGVTFDVTITVTDAEGNSTSATQSVS